MEKVSAESKSLGGNDAEIQETSGGEEQPVGSPASGADGTNVPQEDVEDDLRSRCVKRRATLVPLTERCSDNAARIVLAPGLSSHVSDTRS